MAFYIGNEFSSSGKGTGTGHFFRTDAESRRELKLRPDNLDISMLGNQVSQVAPFFESIDRFAEILTDRLHVAIAACLLGKQVHLYPNTYFKNRAVYLSSIKDYFKDVYFHETFDDAIELPG
jgi:exopolysaccharide biosynthesis predicted pyruvyltransferase EpsI